MHQTPQQRTTSALRLEQLEDRRMMAADFYVDDFMRTESDMSAALDGVEQLLTDAHNMTGVTAARNAYGLTGEGQTAVVIDTGIAWDHPALGGGFGVGYRVVGGYDFTELDGNPYDDGPYGGHGTHVAGIIGSDGTYTGVAPDVDLVGLRVFNDSGAGYFNWVEQALQWVHDNRNAFANPITTVNLSIGSGYNGNTPPNWAMLENEFAQLESDGIFISVAAGNGFATYNTTGLDYPAVSQYVVPVASVDDDGSLSYFSQRNSRVIAAPGRSIMSTIPSYLSSNYLSNNTYGSMSGTSMASPYVAGASVIIRQALEYVGVQNVNEDMIYDWMRDTADTVWDSATNQNYFRLNVGRALDMILPGDEFGSNSSAAWGLGILVDPASVSGTVGRLDDVDYFKFMASDNGSVRVDLTAMNRLVANWDTSGLSGVVQDANGFSFQVSAGQVYSFGLGTSDGIGHFSMTVTMNGDGSAANWVQNRAFIEELYHDVLHRNADGGGLVYWLGQMQSGMSREQVVSGLTLSSERLAPIVDGYYARYLHRQADANGRAYWINNMRSGMGIADVEAYFVDSPEYSTFNASNSAFVDALYADILYRHADGGGRDYWVGMLNGGMSRGAVSDVFLGSREKLTQTIDAYYAQAFDQAIDGATRDMYLDQINNGTYTIDSLIESWLTSDAYYSHASAV